MSTNPCPAPGESRHERLQILFSDPERLKARLAENADGDGDDGELAVIAARVADWRLLDGVPFNYLVPNVELLPGESIRFFRLDNNWVDCLIDGAFSLGRASDADAVLDAALVERFTRQVHRAAHQVRGRLTGAGTDAASVPPDPGPASGFLLRSAAVAGWPGMEAEPFDAGGKALSILRLTHLAEDVLFGLFSGVVQKVYLNPPPEGLHFGFDEKTPGVYTKNLRYTEKHGDAQAGDWIPDAEIRVDSSYFRSASDRVLDVDKVGQAIAHLLQQKEGLDPKSFTSAEFGLEMIVGVPQVEFEIDPPPTSERKR